MRALVLFACSAGALLGFTPAAFAVINDTGSEPQVACAPEKYQFALSGNLAVVGVPVGGFSVQVNGTSAKIAATGEASATAACAPLFFQIPGSKFRWSVASAPRGQRVTISNGNTLAPGVGLPAPGAYRIRLTACPTKCRIKVHAKFVSVGPLPLDVTINALSQFTPPPESEPVLPPLNSPRPGDGENPENGAWPKDLPPSYPQAKRNEACSGGATNVGSATKPQWATAGPFGGASDYRLVEGSVRSSGVAATDQFTNHDSHDYNWEVEPDAPYFGLPHPFPLADMEMEWEEDSLPGRFGPTAGDRASTVGFWIFDCGHNPYNAEIHPPVGLAVERPRPVQIPGSFNPPGFPDGLGSNVHVPGIMTDIWFNRRAGETTSNCSTTGLHQPATKAPPGYAIPYIRGACVRAPHALNRTFSFNIYLPRNPQQRATEAGLNPPPVPLFVGQPQKLPGGGAGGPEPTVTPREYAGVTWLEVTVDLSQLPDTESTYARRIPAAWAYPQPENWGAKRWNVRLKNLHVFDDAEPPGDDGDWRMHFNTNNRDQEWTRFLNCNGCVDDGDNRTLKWGTNGKGLGPDVMLFPGERIFVHATGYDDEVWPDRLGTVFDMQPQRNGDYKTTSRGESRYRLDYAIRAGPSVGGATLTPQGQALLDAYTLKAPPQCTLSQATASASAVGSVRPVCVIAPSRQDPFLVQTWHPDTLVLGKRVRSAGNFEIFGQGEDEENMLYAISASKLKREFDTLRKQDPLALNAFLDDIKQELRAVPVRLRRDYYELVATLDFALPKKLRARPFPAGFRKQVKAFPLGRR